jgi:hypothetical protein
VRALIPAATPDVVPLGGKVFTELAEGGKGTLAPGMLTDLAVRSQDLFTVAADALPATTSVSTLVGGRTLFDAGVLEAAPLPAALSPPDRRGRGRRPGARARRWCGPPHRRVGRCA